MRLLDDVLAAYGDWFWRLRNADRDRAIVIERQGVYYDEYRARLWRKTSTAWGYIYAGHELVLVPVKHEWETFKQERLIGVVNGEVVATPFKGTGEAMDADGLSIFFESHAIADLGNEYERESRGGMNWKILAIIAAVAVIGFVVWKFVLHGQMPGSAITPTPTPTPTPGAPVYSWLLWAVSNV